jgi:hypothetical protein
MSSIAVRRANKRVCPLQPNGLLSRGTSGILAQMRSTPPALGRLGNVPGKTSGGAPRCWPPPAGRHTAGPGPDGKMGLSGQRRASAAYGEAWASDGP